MHTFLYLRLSGRPVSPKTAMEQEKRIRREIANSNERRRMQSINAGFASLKTLLPHHEGEKLSKVREDIVLVLILLLLVVRTMLCYGDKSSTEIRVRAS